MASKEKRDKDYDIVSEDRLDILSENDVMSAIFTTRKMAERANFRQTDETLIATAASELAMNMFRYAGKGQLVIRLIKSGHSKKIGIQLSACDHGPGISDVESAQRDNYSTTKDSLGQGLPSVKRIMDTFEIETALGKGTHITVVKWRDYDRYGLLYFDASTFR